MAGRTKPKNQTAQPPVAARSAGVLLHVTCLPGRFGVGDLGPAAYKWVDTLAAAGQTWWQILPLGPPGNGASPYQAYSAFAGNPLLISPELLVRDGLLKKADLTSADLPADRVDYTRAGAFKAALLDKAWERFTGGASGKLKTEFARFRRQAAAWLEGFTLFLALRARHAGKPWTEWDAPLVRRNPGALREATRTLSGEIDRHAFEQFLFARQWTALKAYANGKGVKLIGDVPIFVSAESSDVWEHPDLVLLDKDRRPTAVAGVPPDYFSKTGQRWGNPLYNWRVMATDGFAWWVHRLEALLEQTDLVRIDHFRGFAACWHVPASEPTAQKGTWVKAPGEALLAAVQQKLRRLPFIAEDLGVITPDVEALRDSFRLPGMRVLQFGFGGGPDNAFLPHNYVRNAIAYTGTHDNDTTVGWFASLSKKQKRSVTDYAPDAAGDPAGALVRLAWQSVADIAITPAQDVLALGSHARINTPGTSDGNWAWRMADNYHQHEAWDRLALMTAAYGRRPEPAKKR